jgi:hypothetical protein
MIIHAAVIIPASRTPVASASPMPVGAPAAAMSRRVSRPVVGEGIFIDIAGAYVGRVIAAAVIVGIIVGKIARSYRKDNPGAAASMLDFNHTVADAFRGLQWRQPDRRGVGCWAEARWTGHEQASGQNRCEQAPPIHEITSFVMLW